MLTSKLGLNASELKQQILDGLPMYNYMGMSIPLITVEGALRSAEDRVERDLDILISKRTVWCKSDAVEPEDIEDNTIILKSLTKPVNWFQGHRQGALSLPKAPVKKILSVHIRTFGPYNAPFEIPLDRVRLESPNMLYFVPGVMGTIFPLSSYLGSYLVADGTRIPAGVEVKYEAGLSKREICNDYYPIITMVKVLAQIEVLTFMQILLGQGTQKEQVIQDGLGNTVEYASRSSMGPLGGEIKALNKLYDDLKNTMRSQFISWTMLQG